MGVDASRRSRVVLLERLATGVAVAVFAVLLWGGYRQGWAWTGFSDNDRLWDWLQLLLLPLALALVPVWLTHRDRVDARRRRLAGAALLAFVVVVLAGYLVPLVWTGFVGNTLWDWLSLLLLPAAAATAVAWRDGRRRLRGHHRAALGAAGVALAIAVLGGYLLNWRWTGFRGTTLWDWLQLLIAPVVLPVVLLPVAAAWVAAEEHRAAGKPATAPVVPPGARAGLRTLSALTLGGIVAVIVLAHHPASEARGRPPRLAPPCSGGGVTVLADPSASVVRRGATFMLCRPSEAPVALGRAGPAGGPSHFRLAAGRLLFVRDRCTAGRSCSSQVLTVRLRSDRRPFTRLRWPATGGISGLYVGSRGTVAVMLRGRCAAGGACAAARLFVQDAHGLRLVAAGPGLDPASLAGTGATVFWRAGGRAGSRTLAT